MLPRKHRLKNTSDFRRAFSKGRHVRGKFGKLVVYSRSDTEPTRIGVVISAKLGKASKRNLARRRIREVLREVVQVMPEGFDISYILWDIGFDYGNIRKELQTLANRIR